MSIGTDNAALFVVDSPIDLRLLGRSTIGADLYLAGVVWGPRCSRQPPCSAHVA